jgi:uncharacterized protein YneF (UPF0154 family)
METELDFHLAYKRVRDELELQRKSQRALVVNPFESKLIEVDLDGWLEELASRVMSDAYIPGAIEVCDAPKGGGLVRPGVRLGIEDRVVYTAAVGACLHEIYSELEWAQGSRDFSPRLDPAELDNREWLRNPFLGWKEWRVQSLELLRRRKNTHVLTADIAGCFENIDIGLLCSDLKRIGCHGDVIALISKCLNGWATCAGRGLPQGVLASDLLAKLYLGSFDKWIRGLNYRHVRYADDIRLFANSEGEAKRALVEVTRALRTRGLTLQSHKTEIRAAEDAEIEFEGVVPVIQEVRQGYIDEAQAAGLMAADESLPIVEIDEITGEVGLPILRRAFDTYIVGRNEINRTMLNFLLRRLGKKGSDHAVEECSRIMRLNPQHTGSIALYFEELEDPDRLEQRVVEALLDETAAIYPYQRYQLLHWLGRNAEQVDETTLHVLREFSRRPESPGYVRAIATQLLGCFGGSSDLEEIESRYKAASDPLERAQLLCCLSALEKGRRNGLAKRVEKDSGWLGRAARLVRAA